MDEDQQAVYAELRRHIGKASPLNAEIAYALRISKRRVCEALTYLDEAGDIERNGSGFARTFLLQDGQRTLGRAEAKRKAGAEDRFTASDRRLMNQIANYHAKHGRVVTFKKATGGGFASDIPVQAVPGCGKQGQRST